MQLGFDELNHAAQNKIWAMNFKRLEQAEVKLDYSWRAESYVQESDDVRNLQLNGREIRNGETDQTLDFEGAIILSTSQPFRQRSH